MAGKRPLYASARTAVLRKDGHRGLWYDKFCDRWWGEDGRWSLSVLDSGEQSKLTWILQVADEPEGVGGEQLAEHTHRMIRLVQARDGWVEVFTAQERFVTGLGRSHPMENGFAWHPTLGTPYLPGSSLKGMLRAWAVEQGQEPLAERLLGSPTSIGEVVLLDAVPVDAVQLEADVMTPHYAGWDPDDPPGDWCSPKPIPFLVAAARTSLLVGVFPRRSDSDSKGFSQVREWLQQAFQTAGAGAKTAVGYGRFRSDPNRTTTLVSGVADAERATRKRQEREQLQATPEGRWRVTVDEASERDVQGLIREQLEAGQLTDPAERAALARAIADAGYPDRWRRGETATETGPKRLKALNRVIAAVLAEADGR